jgi:hypothetical protein
MHASVEGRGHSAAEAARSDSGLSTAYRALDRFVEGYELRDAAVVVDVPGVGRQILHAGRAPLHRDGLGVHDAEPGVYTDPPVAGAHESAADLLLAVAILGLRLDLGTAQDEERT